MGFVPFRCASLYFWSVKLSHPFFFGNKQPVEHRFTPLLFSSWSQRLNNLYTNSSRNSSYATIHTVTRDWGEKEKRRSITAAPITVRASSSSSSPLVGFSRRSSSSSSLHCEPVISSRQHLSISLSRQSTTQFIIVAHSLTSTPTPRRSSIPV